MRPSLRYCFSLPRPFSASNTKVQLLLFLVIIIQQLTVGQTRARALPTPLTAPFSSTQSASQDEGGRDRLETGKATQRQIVGEEKHFYTLRLDAHQFLNVLVRNTEIYVHFRLLSPLDETLAEADDFTGIWGEKRIIFVAPTTGDYRLEIATFDKKAPPATYAIEVKELRAAVPLDLQRVAAAKLMTEAWSLYNYQQTTEKLRQSLAKYEAALTLFRALNDRTGEALAVHHIGGVYRDLGEPQKALAYFNQALPLWVALHDRADEAKALNNIGSSYMYLSEHQKALDYHLKALMMWRELGIRSEQAHTLHEVGYIYNRLGEPLKALENLNAALLLMRDLDSSADPGTTLSIIGGIHSGLGDQTKALDFFFQALPLQRETKDTAGEAATLGKIGIAYERLGERQKALDYDNEAVRLAHTSGFRFIEAAKIYALGCFYQNIGEPQRALDYFTQAQALQHDIGDRANESITLGNLGMAYLSLSNRRKALDYLNQSLTLAQAVKYPQGMAKALTNIGVASSSANDNKVALTFYEQALALHRTLGNQTEEARTLNGLGDSYARIGDNERASAAFKGALAISRTLRERGREAETLYLLARLERDEQKLDAALEHIEASLALIEQLRGALTDQALRTSYFATVQDYYQLRTDLLMRLHQARPKLGFDAKALQSSEQARARSLLDLLVESRVDIRQGVNLSLLQQERSLRQSLAAKADSQQRLLGSKHSPEQDKKIAEELKNLAAEYEQVETRIRESSPRYAALTQSVPLTVKELQNEILDSETLLLEYSLGETRSYLWVIGRDSLASYELPKRAVIEAAARQVYEALTARNRSRANDAEDERQRRPPTAINESADTETNARLSRMLLAPAAASLGTKRLLIVADGSLQYLPFGALFQPSTTSNHTADSSATPLIVAHEIVMLPSASTLAVLRREAGTRQAGETHALLSGLSGKTVAVLADPVFSSNDPRVVRTNNDARVPVNVHTAATADSIVAPSRGVAPMSALSSLPTTDVQRSATESGVNAFTRLRFSREEADSIGATATGAGVLRAIDFDANKATAMSAEFGKHRIIHFATHGLINSVNPELSGIVLSLVDAHGQPQDGFLRLYDIYNLPLETDLVVLSACQTALGQAVRGEGLIGLTRGFMYAGAPRVVASLWRIDDRATAELMRRFYTKMLRDHERPAAALRDAQIEMWQSERWRAPYYWAAFTLQGEWK